MAKYMRNQFNYLGIKTPERREIAKDFLREKAKESEIDWLLVTKLWAQDYREFQYLATDYLKKVQKQLTFKDLPKLYQLAISKSWWDLVDSLDEHVGYIVKHDATCKAVMRDWSLDDNFWIRRIAIDYQLGFKQATDTALLAEIIQNNLGSTEFFINKAIGWALRDYSKMNPEWVSHFIEKNNKKMAKLSIEEGSKYLDLSN
nr:DNA alkylation repair protein [Lactococcus hodotermopsidis]